MSIKKNFKDSFLEGAFLSGPENSFISLSLNQVKKRGLKKKIPLKIIKNLKNKKMKKADPQKKTVSEKKIFDHWVSMDVVLKWLRFHRIIIEKKDFYSNEYEKLNPYVFQNKRLSGFQVLKIANQLRLQEKKEPFLIEGLTF